MLHLSRTLTPLLRSQRKSPVPYRLLLDKNGLFRLPKNCQKVQVLSGTAWVTAAGIDIILNSRETVLLPQTQDVSLISSLTDKPLLLLIG